MNLTKGPELFILNFLFVGNKLKASNEKRANKIKYVAKHWLLPKKKLISNRLR